VSASRSTRTEQLLAQGETLVLVKPNPARRIGVRLRLPPTLLIALVVLALAWTLQLLRPPLTLEIGAADALDTLYLDEGSYLDVDTGLDKGYGGFFAPEVQPAAASAPANTPMTFRWGARLAYLRMHWPLDATPLTATLQISAPRLDRPPDQPGTTITITAVMERDETVLVRNLPINGLTHNYSFQIPTHLTPNLAELRLRLESSNSFQPGKGDTRNLSLIYFRLTLVPAYSAFGWEGWLASFARPILLAMITFFCGAFARQIFTYRRWAWVGESVAGFLLLASLLLWPIMAEPYYAAWAFVLPLGWLLFWLAGIFARRAPNLPTPFVYAATLFPILPLTQFALGRLNLYSINPGSVTFEVYFGALLYCAGMYVRFNLLGSRQDKAFEGAFVRAMLAAAVISFLYNQFFVWQTNLYRGSDFKVYYFALRNYQAGNPLYDLTSILNHPGDAARMPPSFGFLVWPFVQIFTYNVELALAFWRAFNELLFIPVILLLIKIFGGVRDGKKFTPAVIFLCLSFNQVSETIAYGQFNLILLLGLALTALWVKQRRDSWAGAVLAVGAGIKLIPALWAFFWPLERRWRGLIGVAIGLGGVALLTALTVGWDNLWLYLIKIVFGVNRPEIAISNQSWFGFLGRLSVPKVMDDYKGELAAWVIWLGYGGALVFTCLTLFVVWRKHGGDSTQDLLKLSSLNFLSLLIPPFIWFHYVTLGLVSILTLLVVLGSLAPEQSLPRWQLLVFGLAFATLAYGGRNDFFFTDAVGLARLGSSYRFGAVAALWLLSLYYLWKPSPPAFDTPA